MTKFEVGKYYRCGEEGKSYYRINSRTAKSAVIAEVFADGSFGETMRKKIYAEECSGLQSERIYPYGSKGTSAYSVISSRYEVSINANDNDTALASQPAAVANAEYETNTQQNDGLFRVGNVYVSGNNIYTVSKLTKSGGRSNFVVFIDQNGNTIRKRISIYGRINGEWSRVAEHCKNPDVSSEKKYIYCDSDCVQLSDMPAKITQPEISQPEALYDDDSFSDAPGDNSDNARNQDFPVDFPECTHAEITQPDLSAPIDNNPLQHLKPCPACHSTHIPFLKRCDDNNSSTATRRFNGGIARQHIYYRLKCRDCGHEVIATIFRSVDDGFVIPHQNEADVKKKVFQNWDSQYTKNPGFTIVPSEHIERPQYTTYPDTITDECPYVTVPACDIPDNHNSAADVVPHVNPITAATMRLASNLAALLFVVCKIIIPLMFMRKKDLRRVAPKFVFTVGYKYPAYFHDKQQIITISDRRTDKYGFSWLSFIDEDNISYNVRVKLRYDGYTELLDFKELERTCYAFEGLKPVKESNRVKYIKFEVGKSYTAVSGEYGCHHEKHFTVLDRFSAVRVGFNDKFAHLKVRMTDSYHKDKSAVGWILVSVDRNIHAESYSCGYKINFRADNPDPVQVIPTETRNTTPKSRKPESAPASTPADIEHKLIDTKELHFADKRKALDHNAAVITSCMFPEAVISLLMSISAKAVIQLGFHMGLFIAKPKGKKNVIAELFAQRLIARRDIRANVRSKSDNTDAKNTPDVPDGVKFFVGARRQICFKFED